MRVSLVERAASSASAPGESGASWSRAPREPAKLGAAALAVLAPPTRAISVGTRRTEPQPGRAGGSDSEGPARAALVTPVQSDVWMLAARSVPAEEPGGDSPSAGRHGGRGAPGDAAGPKGQGSGDADGRPGTGAGGSAGVSLLAELSQRLAWSAARCTPATFVRAARHTIPGVPLHFCLDAAGRPSDVGLLGTTGSEQLDRAARDCVVPGALPLPPAPGCYTVEVRFPIRG